MNASTRATRIQNQDEFSAVVRALRENLSGRYVRLGREMKKIGEPTLEAIFHALLTDIEEGNAPRARLKPTEDENHLVATKDPLANGPRELDGLWSPYAIWAFAVRNEIDMFEELTSLNIPIDDAHLQTALATEAQACLSRAATYRVQRRLAFHAERLANEVAQFPDIRRIDTVEDFAHVALAIEQYFMGLLRRHNGSEPGISDVVLTTEKAVSDLESMTQGADVPKRLQNALKRLTGATSHAPPPAEISNSVIAKIALEADRIFDYYDRVFDTSLDPHVIEAAQRMSANTVDRLRLLRDLRSAA